MLAVSISISESQYLILELFLLELTIQIYANMIVEVDFGFYKKSTSLVTNLGIVQLLRKKSPNYGSVAAGLLRVC